MGYGSISIEGTCQDTRNIRVGECRCEIIQAGGEISACKSRGFNHSLAVFGHGNSLHQRAPGFAQW
jgi:hypothetical protein